MTGRLVPDLTRQRGNTLAKVVNCLNARWLTCTGWRLLSSMT